MRRIWPLVLLGACASSDPLEDELTDDGKADGPAGFAEVDPSHSTRTFRRYIEAAIRHLEADGGELAALTARSIRDRRVRLDELVDLTCWDFERVRADLPDAGLVPVDYHRLRLRGSPVAAAITEALDGYMWSDRIYVARGLTVKRLAATLVHEVNHVVNRSEVGYYDDLPTSGFVHEYRAFHAEAIFDPEEYAGVDLVDYVVENYELARAEIDPAILAEPLTPILLPDDTAWAERRVEDDEPDDDTRCPANL